MTEVCGCGVWAHSPHFPMSLLSTSHNPHAPSSCTLQVHGDTPLGRRPGQNQEQIELFGSRAWATPPTSTQALPAPPLVGDHYSHPPNSWQPALLKLGSRQNPGQTELCGSRIGDIFSLVRKNTIEPSLHTAKSLSV